MIDIRTAVMHESYIMTNAECAVILESLRFRNDLDDAEQQAILRGVIAILECQKLVEYRERIKELRAATVIRGPWEELKLPGLE